MESIARSSNQYSAASPTATHIGSNSDAAPSPLDSLLARLKASQGKKPKVTGAYGLARLHDRLSRDRAAQPAVKAAREKRRADRAAATAARLTAKKAA